MSFLGSSKRTPMEKFEEDIKKSLRDWASRNYSSESLSGEDYGLSPAFMTRVMRDEKHGDYLRVFAQQYNNADKAPKEMFFDLRPGTVTKVGNERFQTFTFLNDRGSSGYVGSPMLAASTRDHSVVSPSDVLSMAIRETFATPDQHIRRGKTLSQELVMNYLYGVEGQTTGAPLQHLYTSGSERAETRAQQTMSVLYKEPGKEWDTNQRLEEKFYSRNSNLRGFWSRFDTSARVTRVSPYGWDISDDYVQTANDKARKNDKLLREREIMTVIRGGKIQKPSSPTDTPVYSNGNPMNPEDRYVEANLVRRGETRPRSGFLTSHLITPTPLASGAGLTYRDAIGNFGNEFGLDSTPELSGFTVGRGESPDFGDLARGKLEMLDSGLVGKSLTPGKHTVARWYADKNSDDFQNIQLSIKKDAMYWGTTFHSTIAEGDDGKTDPFGGEGTSPVDEEYVRGLTGLSSDRANVRIGSGRGLYMTADITTKVDVNAKDSASKMGHINAYKERIGVDYVGDNVKSPENAAAQNLASYTRPMQERMINFAFGKRMGNKIISGLPEGAITEEGLSGAYSNVVGNGRNENDFYGQYIVGLRKNFNRLSVAERDKFYEETGVYMDAKNKWIPRGEVSRSVADYTTRLYEEEVGASNVGKYYRVNEGKDGKLTHDFHMKKGDIMRMVQGFAPEHTGMPIHNLEQLQAFNDRWPKISEELGIKAGTPQDQSVAGASDSISAWKASWNANWYNQRDLDAFQSAPSDTVHKITPEMATNIKGAFDSGISDDSSEEHKYNVISRALHEFAGIDPDDPESRHKLMDIGGVPLETPHTAKEQDVFENGMGRAYTFQRYSNALRSGIDTFVAASGHYKDEEPEIGEDGKPVSVDYTDPIAAGFGQNASKNIRNDVQSAVLKQSDWRARQFSGDTPSDMMKSLAGRVIPGAVFRKYSQDESLEMNEVGYTDKALMETVRASGVPKSDWNRALGSLKSVIRAGDVSVISDRYPYQNAADIGIRKAVLMPKGTQDIRGIYVSPEFAAATAGDGDGDPLYDILGARWNAEKRIYEKRFEGNDEIEKAQTSLNRAGAWLDAHQRNKLGEEWKDFDVNRESVKEHVEGKTSFEPKFVRKRHQEHKVTNQEFIDTFSVTGKAYNNTMRAMLAATMSLGQEGASLRSLLALPYNKAFDAIKGSNALVNMMSSARFSDKGELKAHTGSTFVSLDAKNMAGVRSSVIDLLTGDLAMKGGKGTATPEGVAVALGSNDENMGQIENVIKQTIDNVDDPEDALGTIRQALKGKDSPVAQGNDFANTPVWRALKSRAASQTARTLEAGTNERYKPASYVGVDMVPGETLDQILTSDEHTKFNLGFNMLRRIPGPLSAASAEQIHSLRQGQDTLSKLMGTFFDGLPAEALRENYAADDQSGEAMMAKLLSSGIYSAGTDSNGDPYGEMTLDAKKAEADGMTTKGGRDRIMQRKMALQRMRPRDGKVRGRATLPEEEERRSATSASRGGRRYSARSLAGDIGGEVNIRLEALMRGKGTNPVTVHNQITEAESMLNTFPETDMAGFTQSVMDAGVGAIGQKAFEDVQAALAKGQLGDINLESAVAMEAVKPGTRAQFLSEIPQEQAKHLGKVMSSVDHAFKGLDGLRKRESVLQHGTTEASIERITKVGDRNTSLGGAREMLSAIQGPLGLPDFGDLTAKTKKLSLTFEEMAKTGKTWQTQLDKALSDFSDPSASASARAKAGEQVKLFGAQLNLEREEGLRSNLQAAISDPKTDIDTRVMRKEQLRETESRIGSLRGDIQEMTEGESGPGKWNRLTSGAKRVMGGWGLMYLGRVIGMGKNNLAEGYAENQQFSQQQAESSAAYYGAGAYRPSTVEAEYQAALRRTAGSGQAAITGALTPFVGTPADSALGAGKAALGGGLAAAFIGKELGFAALGGPAGVAGAALAGATAYVGLEVAGKRMNPETTIRSALDHTIKSEDYKESGHKFAAFANFTGAVYDALNVSKEDKESIYAYEAKTSKVAMDKILAGEDANFDGMTELLKGMLAQNMTTKFDQYNPDVVNTAWASYSFGSQAGRVHDVPFGEEYINRFIASPNIGRYSSQVVSAAGGIPSIQSSSAMSDFMVSNGMTTDDQQARFAAGATALMEIPNMDMIAFGSGKSMKDFLLDAVSPTFDGTPPEQYRSIRQANVALSERLGKIDNDTAQAQLELIRNDSAPASMTESQLKDAIKEATKENAGLATESSVRDFWTERGKTSEEASQMAADFMQVGTTQQAQSTWSTLSNTMLRAESMGMPVSGLGQFFSMGSSSPGAAGMTSNIMSGIMSGDPYMLARFAPGLVPDGMALPVGMTKDGELSQTIRPFQQSWDLPVGGDPTSRPYGANVQPGSVFAASIWGGDWQSGGAVTRGGDGEIVGFREAMAIGMHDSSGIWHEGAVGGEVWQNRQGYNATMASLGMQYKQEMAKWAFTTGVGLEKYAPADPRTGEGFDIQNSGGFWGIEDKGAALQRSQVSEGWAYQQASMALRWQGYALQGQQLGIQAKRLDLQDLQFGIAERGLGLSERQMGVSERRFEANIGYNDSMMKLGRTQQLMQRGFAREDWATQDNVSALQWKWKTEDYQEQARFMTGRDRSMAERNRGRDTIMHNIEGEEKDKGRSRQENVWKLEDKRFRLQESRQRQDIEFERELMGISREQFELRKEQLEIQRTQLDLGREQYEIQVQQHDLTGEQIKIDEAHMIATHEFQLQRMELEDESRELQRAYQVVQHQMTLEAIGTAAYFAEQMMLAADDIATARESQDEFFSLFASWLLEYPLAFQNVMNEKIGEIAFYFQQAMQEAIDNLSVSIDVNLPPSGPPPPGGGGGGITPIDTRTGKKVEQKALGGWNDKGDIAWTGEHEPEILVAPFSGTVIPMHKINPWQNSHVSTSSPSSGNHRPLSVEVFIGSEKLDKKIIKIVEREFS